MENNKSLAEVISSQTSLTKETINEVADVILAEFESGKIDQLEFLGKMEFMAQALDKAISKIRQQVVDELEKYGSEAKFGVVKSGITFKLTAIAAGG
jgi:ribosome-associated translation inhibitor RaiA